MGGECPSFLCSAVYNITYPDIPMRSSKTRQVARVRELLPWLPPPNRPRCKTLDLTKPSLTNGAVLKAITGKTLGAKELLAVYSQASRQPGFRHDYLTYKTLTSKLAHLKRFRAVDLLLSRMRHEGLPCGPGILLPLIEIYACAGFLDKAVDLFLTTPIHEKVFSKVLDVLVHEGRLELASALFSDEVIFGLGFPIRVRNYIGLVRAYLNREGIGPAIDLLDLMAGRGSVPDVFCYGSLINGLSCSGRMDPAFKVLDQMRRVGREPDVVLFNSLVCGCIRNGEIEKAEKIVREIEDKGFGADTGTYNTLIEGICDRRNVADGVDILYRMMDRGVAPDVITFTTLMSRLCRKGKVMEFNTLFGKMVRMGVAPDAACYRILFSRFCGNRMIIDTGFE